jgi:fluoroquinolone transport system permease protein
MKAMMKSFLLMLRLMKTDAMLIMIIACPFLMGIFFRFAIPFFENVLTNYFNTKEIFAPYYLLFDTFLLTITSSMCNFAVAMIMLEESDDHITSSLSVTPLGKSEGIAVGKFASLLNVGAIIPFFVNGKVQFFASIFPSFWIGKAMQRNTYHLFLVSILLSSLWIIVSSKKLMRKIAG